MGSLTFIYLIGTLFSILMLGFIMGFIILHQKRVVQYNLHLKEQELAKQQALLIALNEGEETERKRLAEELHDGIGAKLSGLKMSLDYLGDSDLLDRTLLQKLSDGMSESINEIREISQNLKPTSFFSKGLHQALNDYVLHLNNNDSCIYSLYFDNIDKVINQEIQFMLYRIISELLNNIKKHANATQASIQLFLSEDNILNLIAEDNGIGFTLTYVPAGIGLSNIKSRLERHQGTLIIDSTNAGTTII